MNPFNFLKNVNSGYGDVKGTLEQYFPSNSLNFRMDVSPKSPTLNLPPTPKAPAPNYSNDPSQLTDNSNSGPNSQVQPQGFIQQILSMPTMMGNPTLMELLARYQTLRTLFPDVEGGQNG